MRCAHRLRGGGLTGRRAFALASPSARLLRLYGCGECSD